MIPAWVRESWRRVCSHSRPAQPAIGVVDGKVVDLDRDEETRRDFEDIAEKMRHEDLFPPWPRGH